MTNLNNNYSEPAVEQAAKVLASGNLVAIPTETVYGLAADAEQDEAVAKIFAAKGRPSDHPLIVHVLDQEQAKHFASDLPEFAKKLMAAFWPGPLTIIVPRKISVATASAGGHDSIGLRSPSHPVARDLLEKCLTLGVRGLAAPSANLFGRVSPTTAAHVRADFPADLLVLDGGECSVGIESTIVDCTRQEPVLLRPGMISSEQIELATQASLQLNSSVTLQGKEAPKASGTLESHYAPKAKVRLFCKNELEQNIFEHTNSSNKNRIGVYSTLPKQVIESIIWQLMPNDAAQCAHDLFSVLREFDQHSVSEIWVENVPESAIWAGVKDRLKRAAASA
jgi:L-threonylcarbamoyladenylate synthase